MEPIDILTPDGAPTGEVLDKAEAHRIGAWHRAVHLWLIAPAGKVLLQRRAETKENWPGRWDVSVAGHVGAGETAVEAAVREAREELGLQLAPSELVHVGTVREQCVLNRGAYIDNEIHEVFLARRDIDPAALILDPDEVEEVKLVAPADLAGYDPVPHPAEYAFLRTLV
jgi:isopentenyldiphosphate isomerase